MLWPTKWWGNGGMKHFTNHTLYENGHHDSVFMSLCVKFLIEDVRYCRNGFYYPKNRLVESSWNVMAHGDAREGKWRGNWRIEWVTSTLHTTSEHGLSTITTVDAHTSAASSRLNWRPSRFKWTRPFRQKTKCGFCACAITFQTKSTAHKSPRGSCCVFDQTSLFRCPTGFM